MSSHDVAARIRRILGVKKAGHCGALDPDAAGVLPVCVGAATGIAGYLTGACKQYRVEAVAGLLTDTLDASGAVIRRRDEHLPERKVFESALISFLGAGKQTPPMYSAIKTGGRKLYEFARKGVEIDRAPRDIEIYALNIVYYGNDRVIFDAACSKGTYIRSLCRDIGERLGIYLCMSFLLRAMSAGLCVGNASTLENVEKRMESGGIGEILIPADALLNQYPEVDLNNTQYGLFRNGVPVMPEKNCRADMEATIRHNFIVRIYNDGRFIGLGDAYSDGDDDLYVKIKKFLIDPDER